MIGYQIDKVRRLVIDARFYRHSHYLTTKSKYTQNEK